MLHAPISETKTDTMQSKSPLAPVPERELHAHSFGATQAYSLNGARNTASVRSPEAQQRQMLMGMQSTYGNQAVLRMMQGSQQVARLPALRPSRGIMLQRKCACGGSSEAEGECAECKEKREAMLQRSVGNQAAPSAAPAVPPIVHNVLSSPGQPLDAGTRAFMEPRFGHDFSHVRVHTDTKEAEESARAVHALAYTVGKDVVFGEGQYAPGTSEGQQLLAHELTHVVQQENPPVSQNLSISTPTDRAEREAEATARYVLQQRALPTSVQKEGTLGTQPASSSLYSTGTTSVRSEVSVKSGYPLAIARSPAEEPQEPNIPDYTQEKNVPQKFVKGKQGTLQQEYEITAFDIGSSNLGSHIQKELDAIIKFLLEVDDERPRAEITGYESKSRLEGKGPYVLGWERADAIKNYFIRNKIPAAWIITNSLGNLFSPPATASPSAKAEARKALIKIELSGKPKPSKPSELPKESESAIDARKTYLEVIEELARYGLPVRFLRIVSQHYTIRMREKSTPEVTLRGLKTIEFKTETIETLNRALLESELEKTTNEVDSIYHESTHAYVDLLSNDPDMQQFVKEATAHYEGAPTKIGAITTDTERLFNEAAAEYVGDRITTWLTAFSYLSHIIARSKAIPPDQTSKLIRKARENYNKNMAHRVFGHFEKSGIFGIGAETIETTRPISDKMKQLLDHKILEDKIPDQFDNVETFKRLLTSAGL